jgi:hypothetical protein
LAPMPRDLPHTRGNGQKQPYIFCFLLICRGCPEGKGPLEQRLAPCCILGTGTMSLARVTLHLALGCDLDLERPSKAHVLRGGIFGGSDWVTRDLTSSLNLVAIGKYWKLGGGAGQSGPLRLGPWGLYLVPCTAPSSLLLLPSPQEASTFALSHLPSPHSASPRPLRIGPRDHDLKVGSQEL